MLCHYFMNNKPSDLSVEKTMISLISRIFPHIPPDAGFDSKSVQKAPILLHGYVTSFIRCVWPLESTVAQPKRKQAEPYALKDQAFEPILLHTAEEKKRPFFQWIQSVGQADNGGQPVDTPSEIGSPTCHQDPFDPFGLPKHVESPRGSWTRFSRWSYFRHRPGTVPTGSWHPLKKKSRDCSPEQKAIQSAVSVHRR